MHPADLEPFEVLDRTYVTRRRLNRFDATTLLCVMVGMLTMIPAQLIIPGTSYVGRPAMIVCVLACFWWLVARVSPWLPLTGRQPIRWALLGFVLSMIISYAVGFMRGLTPMESNASDLWMISVIAFAGVILTAADGIANWERLRTLLRFFVVCCGFMSVIGLVQFIAAFDIVPYMFLPGFEVKGTISELQARGSEIRVASTALHYIELSTVLAIALPFALHLTRFSATRRSRRFYGVVSAILLAGNLATISRTGMVAIGIVMIVLLPLWGWRLRYNAIVVGIGMLAMLAVARPSLARTIYDLFVNAGADSSITSRTERYGMVGYYFSQRPWFGRGSGTWVSPQYQYLDNSWLATALTNGIVGVAALAALHLTAITLAVLAIRRATSNEDKHLCAGLLATQIIAIFGAATFDSLWFTTGAVTIMLTIGLCGTVWRLTHTDLSVRTAAPRRLDRRR